MPQIKSPLSVTILPVNVQKKKYHHKRRRGGYRDAQHLPAASISLPSTSAGLPSYHIILISGVASTTLQYGLERLFQKKKKQKSSPENESAQLLQKTSAQTAHSIVALLLMLLVSTVGVSGMTAAVVSSPSERLFQPNPTARWLSAVLAGSFLFWDIPMSTLRLKKSMDVIVHHVIMFLLTVLGATVLPTWYCLYYFGVAELSSIPLIVYDQLHNWREATTVIEKEEEQQSTVRNDDVAERTTKPASPLLWMTSAKLESTIEAVAAVAFTLVRAISFPYMTALHFLPDCWKIWKHHDITTKWILPIIMTMSIGFTILQLYWFSLIIKTIVFSERKEVDTQ